jgi:methyl-accepting chemotaxis protein
LLALLRASFVQSSTLASRFKRPGILGTLLGTFLVSLAITLGALYAFISTEVSTFMESSLATHGRAHARELATLLAAMPPGNPPTSPLEALVRTDKDFKFAALVTEGRQVLAASGARPDDLPELLERYRNQGSPSQLLVPGGDLILFEPLTSQDGAEDSRRVMVVMDRSKLNKVLATLRLTVMGAFFLGLVLVTALVFVVFHYVVLRPLDSMTGVARKLAEGDLTGRVEVPGEGELAQLAEALNSIGQALRNTLGNVRGVSEVVSSVIEQLSRTGTTVSSGASTIQARVEETSSSMEEMLASLRGIAENVEVLYQSAEESSSSIMQMAATNDEVAENVQNMAGSVEETTSAIEEMTFSIKEVAKNIAELSSSTEQTSSSISQMDSSISQVEANANETAKLSERVSEDAQTGVEALRKTLEGIDRIKESSRTAAVAIESLGRRISEIGNILNVIDDVAEQTNLLALNAAIIAAQAGEHGKGFAVVADEIKDLAERTGASTKEISELIRGVQDESRNAVTVMNQGVRNVEEGVLLGREAESALRKISESALKATQMVKAIARATVEQARGSRQVTTAIHRISETVQMINKASNEQARGGEQINASAERMKTITSHVQKSSQEQAHGSKQITRSIESINEMVTHLNRAQKEQTKGSEQVLKAVETIKAVSEHQTRSVRQLEEAIDSLQRQSEVLRAEVRRFRV